MIARKTVLIGITSLLLTGIFATFGTGAWASHIPDYILKEIEREANEPYCHYQNRLNGTNYDCSNSDADYVECFVWGLHEDISTHQQALDLLGQLKVSNTYYGYYDLPENNEYLSADNFEILDFITFMCGWG